MLRKCAKALVRAKKSADERTGTLTNGNIEWMIRISESLHITYTHLNLDVCGYVTFGGALSQATLNGFAAGGAK